MAATERLSAELHARSVEAIAAASEGAARGDRGRPPQGWTPGEPQIVKSVFAPFGVAEEGRAAILRYHFFVSGQVSAELVEVDRARNFD